LGSWGRAERCSLVLVYVRGFGACHGAWLAKAPLWGEVCALFRALFSNPPVGPRCSPGPLACLPELSSRESWGPRRSFSSSWGHGTDAAADETLQRPKVKAIWRPVPRGAETRIRGRAPADRRRGTGGADGCGVKSGAPLLGKEGRRGGAPRGVSRSKIDWLFQSYLRRMASQKSLRGSPQRQRPARDCCPATSRAAWVARSALSAHADASPRPGARPGRGEGNSRPHPRLAGPPLSLSRTLFLFLPLTDPGARTGAPSGR